MVNIDSYLSEDFLQEFIKTFPRDFFSEDFLPNVELYRFLDRHTNIILGGEKEDYSELIRTDGLARNLIDRYLQGDTSVKIENWDETYLLANSKIFKFGFLGSGYDTLNSKLNKLGFATFQIGKDQNPKNIIGYEAITVTRKTNSSNRLISWENLRKTKILPFHSIVIIDNYLFASPWQTDATISMVEKLLSNNNDVDIVFVYSHDKYNITDKNTKKKKQIIYSWDKIERKIKESSFGNFKKISVFKLLNTYDFHDRVIITNSQFIISGNSFSNFFNKEGNIKIASPTLVNINTHACSFGENDWCEVATGIIDYIKDLIEGSSTICLGSPLTNPLFSI